MPCTWTPCVSAGRQTRESPPTQPTQLALPASHNILFRWDRHVGQTKTFKKKIHVSVPCSTCVLLVNNTNRIIDFRYHLVCIYLHLQPCPTLDKSSKMMLSSSAVQLIKYRGQIYVDTKHKFDKVFTQSCCRKTLTLCRIEEAENLKEPNLLTLRSHQSIYTTIYNKQV